MTVHLPIQISSILGDMQEALGVGLYYPALQVALTLPEICSALLLPANESVRGKHYKDFIAKYCVEDEIGANAEVCYQLRCGVTHRGNAAGGNNLPYNMVVFLLPGSPVKANGAIGLGLRGGFDAKMFDVDAFIKAMTSGVVRWFETNGDNPLVRKNLKGLLHLHPDGLEPVISGYPALGSYVVEGGQQK